MDLNLSDEQRLLRESVERFVGETYNAEHRRRLANDPLGFSAGIWKQFAELGWLALPIPEEYGGLRGGGGGKRIFFEGVGGRPPPQPPLSPVVARPALRAGCGREGRKPAVV